MKITYRPIDRWPGELTRGRTKSPFQASESATKRLLIYEVGRLEGKQLVVQLAIGEMDLRVDGEPKMRANYKHPGVIVAFESKHGPLKYSTDTFNDWLANLRAIALGLEDLRRLDRYGISKRGEQYTGWRALEAPTPMGSASSVEDAWSFLEKHSGVAPIIDGADVRNAYRIAAKRLHPDADGGDADLFRKLGEVRDTLLEAHG